MNYIKNLSNVLEPNLPYVDPSVLNTANSFLNITISVGTSVFNATPTTYPRIEIKSQIVNTTSCKITSTLFTSTSISPKVSTRIIIDDVARKLFILQQQIPFENEMYLATYMDDVSGSSQNSAYIRGFLCYIAWISLIEDGHIWVSDFNFDNSKDTYLSLSGLYYTDLIMEYQYAAVPYNYSLLLSTALGWSRVWRDPLYAIIMGTFEVLYLQNYYNEAHDFVSLETTAVWNTRCIVFSALKK